MSEPVDQSDAGTEAEAPIAGSASPQDASAAPETSGAAGAADSGPVDLAAQVDQLKALVAERTDDLQRVQAEYVNYKKRVDRDRTLARKAGVEAVLRDLIPVSDAIAAAGAHDELSDGFKITADELTKVTKSYGFESFGEAGDEFDPRFHEALMQVPSPDVTEMEVHEVMQVGYRINDLVLRPARVVVAVPADE